VFTLTDFSLRRPRYRVDQSRALEWLSEIHATAQATLEGLSSFERNEFVLRYRRLLERCACGPDKIGARGQVAEDVNSFDFSDSALYDVTRHPHGRGTAARTQLFSKVVDAYFEQEYEAEHAPPSELIHVTCTGYVAPSGAQRLVASKGWDRSTQVTHAYHMGCYAALPAIRGALGHLSVPAAFAPSGVPRRADIVHTELCSLHLDPSAHSAEQCVVQSLFADGFVRYSLRANCDQLGLDVLSLSECVLPGSSEAMGWRTSDFGMQMTLARDVPERVASALRPIVVDLLGKAGLSVAADLRRTIFAVHPGGPKIIDRVRDALELSDAQVQASRDVLYEYGNMSSATLPHVWARLVEAADVRSGTPIVSLAFGPGLTVCGGLFRKR
jgi:predicted naringenin-chalcone synthase